MYTKEFWDKAIYRPATISIPLKLWKYEIKSIIPCVGDIFKCIINGNTKMGLIGYLDYNDNKKEITGVITGEMGRKKDHSKNNQYQPGVKIYAKKTPL